MKKKTLRKICIFFIAQIILISGAVFYLNKFFLPVKMKSLVIQTLENATQKKVSLDQLELNIFKGIVLKNLVISDGPKTLISIKEGACSFLLLPILKEKKIIIPNIRLTSPSIFLERRKDNSFNLTDLIPQTPAPGGQKSKFAFLLSGLSVTGARIDFQDSSLTPAFTKTIDNLNLSANLSLPASVKFNMKSQILTSPPAKISASGEAKPLTKEVVTKISLSNIPLKEFSPYYQGLKADIPEGIVDADINLQIKDKLINADLESKNKSLSILKDKLSIKSDSGLSAKVSYNLETRQLAYSGTLNIENLDAAGIDKIERIDNIKGIVNFSQDGLNSDKLSAKVFGVPIETKLSLQDFKAPLLKLSLQTQLDFLTAQKILTEKFKITLPVNTQGTGKLNLDLETALPLGVTPTEIKPVYSGILNIERLDVSEIEKIDKIDNVIGQVNFNQDGLSSRMLTASIYSIPFEAKLLLKNFQAPLITLNILTDLDLAIIQKLLGEKFKISLPAQIEGQGKMKVDAETKLPLKQMPQVNGSIEISNAQAKIAGLKEPIANISGHFDFNLASLKWVKLSADYSGKTYSSDGSLKNFTAPNISCNLSTEDLSLEAGLNLRGKIINFTRLKGRYLNSDFAAEGSIDTSTPGALPLKITAGINLDIQDVKKPLVKFKDTLEKIKPSGLLNAELNIDGNIKDFKSCSLTAKLTSLSLSVYGLNFQNFYMSYNQAQGIGQIPLAHLALYDGAIEATGSINLASPDLPYQASVYLDGLKIEKLKNDTPMKEKDLAGTLQMQAKANGFSNDLAKLNGAGKIMISQGKLWQLNLFRGIGELLFTKDFANIVFSDGYCEFFIKDKFIFTDNLKLKGNLVTLAGSGKIGFDSSLDASINVEMSDEIAPQTATIRDITTAIIGQAGRFAVIKLSGTLKEPKYKLQPAVKDVIKGLQDFVIGNVLGK